MAPTYPTRDGCLLFVDTSAAGQGLIDFDSLNTCNSGVRANFGRAVNGSDTDKVFASNATRANNAHMWKGSYGVFYPKYPAQPQAKAYADVAKPVAELRPVIDFEVLGGVDPKTAADRALDYIKATEDAWGCACIFYSYPAFISVLETANATTMQAIASRCDLWLAQYTTWANPSVPTPWKAWSAWQFDGDKGLTLPSGTDCDFSWFNGDEVDFLARWKRNP